MISSATCWQVANIETYRKNSIHIQMPLYLALAKAPSIVFSRLQLCNLQARLSIFTKLSIHRQTY